MRKICCIAIFFFSVTAHGQLLNSLEIQFTELVTPSFHFTIPSEYSSGLTVLASTSVSVISDQDWVVSIGTGGSTNFSTTTGDLMPVSDASAKVTTSGTWTNLSSVDQTLTTGLATYFVNGLLQIVSTGNGNSSCATIDVMSLPLNVSCFTFTVDYKLNLSGFYESGDYNATIFYTLSAQ